jgi:DNA-binding transcriptional regulator YdaS (Cro superfamily)
MPASGKKLRAGKNSQRQDVTEAQDVMQRLRAQRGALSALAVELGLTAQAVHQWDVIPLQRVLAVEKVLGIPRAELRPDVFAAK